MLTLRQNEAMFMRFVEQFIASERRESLILNFRRAYTKQKPIDYHKYFLSGCARDITWEVNKGKVNLLDCLSRGRQFTTCYLFWSEPWITGFLIDVSTLANRDLSFFPDSYWVSFESRCALALTRDADTVLCEINGGSR
jgi:hypothetical protein